MVKKKKRKEKKGKVQDYIIDIGGNNIIYNNISTYFFLILYVKGKLRYNNIMTKHKNISYIKLYDGKNV
ncbi:hypothetical protein PFNF135_01148 [Plasmodium falciparum NF135/5.C10]|uniref:Uncharacterized protein n=2 Tax=Plasmodium falciparum TaxID=5833 RepID=A0A024VAV8_PLAFA|nr:hypothetical protein PFFVO_01055 [Plasmodium falciparum Vietnam Oak-Knoll (FVO)]ETW44579.1 hypothetical protein PFNF135_01148 [Plasmodium falciparum NF135/5.C10]